MRALVLAGVLAALSCAPAAALTVLNRGNGTEIKTLDPHFIDGLNESSVEGDLLVGLLTMDAAGAPIPGAATGWSTSPDGKTWTFRLRNHLWCDGRPVTAADFVFAWRRLLDPKTGASYAYNLWVVKNAHAISLGRLPPTALGVRAPDDRTLVVALEHPAAYFAELLTHDTAYPLPRHVVTAKGSAWSKPGNFVGNGPYVPREWTANDHVTLVKNPRFYDAAHVRIDVVNFFPTPDSDAALRRFRVGELDTQTPIPLTQIDWLRKFMPQVLHTKPYLGLSYVSINLRHPPLNDVRVRRALNLGLDRETITQRVLRLGEPPAYSIVPPSTANYPSGGGLDFRRQPFDQRLAKARWLMNQAGYGAGNPLHLVFETFDEPNNKRIAAVMQSMMRQIWVDLDIMPVEGGVHSRNMRAGNYDLGAASWFADFNDASNFLDLLRSDAGNNYGRYTNLAFDRLLDSAQEEPDARRRGALLAEAEAMALKDYPWIPMRFRTTQDLVQPYVKGWVDNIRDLHRTRWLWIEGRPAAQ
ncbi:MAG: peptide ABC transporter substrate-binding protein [Rhizomicrobium sp.]